MTLAIKPNKVTHSGKFTEVRPLGTLLRDEIIIRRAIFGYFSLRIGSAVLESEKSPALDLAKMKTKNTRPMESRYGLYEVLAPGSSAIKTDEYTSRIKEPESPDFLIGDTEILKY